MANYGAELIKGTTSITVGVGSIETAAALPRRFQLYDLIFSSNVAGDTQFEFRCNRITTPAVGTLVTPNPLDLADPAATTITKQNLTVNGTETAGAIPLGFGMNQRSTFRWACKDGKEIIAPATASNGFQFDTPVALLTPPAIVNVMFAEL